MRKDAKKNLTKVTKEVIKDPLATIDEIASKTGLSHGTVHDKLTKVDSSVKKTDDIIEICKKDIEIVRGTQELIEKWVKNFGDKVPKREDINTATKAGAESQKRYSILKGDGTDQEGGARCGVIVLPELKYD